MFRYYMLNKPYGYLSQFTDEGQWKGLSQLIRVPSDVYAIGRLDADSEGLLLLTNNPALNRRVLHPSFKLPKTYWVQVEGLITPEAISRLSQGVMIRVNGKDHQTAPAGVRQIEEPSLPPRNPPVRFRAAIPTSWIELVISEGKNRQIRKMTAAAGFPTLRLFRAGIGTMFLDEMASGECREMEEAAFSSLLFGKQQGYEGDRRETQPEKFRGKQQLKQTPRYPSKSSQRKRP